MKKRVVAILLSLTMCSSMVTEAGAAAVPDSAVESDSENSFSDSESDVTVEEEPMDGGETEAPEDTDGGNISIEDPEGEMQQPSDEPSDNTDSNGMTDSTEPETGFADDLFSSGDNLTDLEQKPQTVPEMENTTAEPAADFESEDAEKHTATLLYTRWKLEEGNKWMLQKLPKANDTVVDNGNSEVLDGTASDDGTVQESVTDVQTEPQTADISTESMTASEEGTDADEEMIPETETVPGEADQPETIPETVPDAETVPETETVPEAEMPADPMDSEQYYKDTMVEITTVDSNGTEMEKGTYYFDKDGYLVTGQTVVKQGTDGFAFDADAEFFFLDDTRAEVETVAADSAADRAAEIPTPFNSDLGQMQTGWMWDGEAFHHYSDDGREEEIKADIYEIDGVSYYVQADGKPYDKGIVYIKPKKSYYAFSTSKNDKGIPGQMIQNGWAYRKMSKGNQWLYFQADGRYKKMASGAYKLLEDKDVLYLIDNSGYLVKNKMIRAGNGKYYLSNKYGHVYRNRLQKYGKYRYYFCSDGTRAAWRNRWVKLGANTNNRYYYFGNTSGCVQEKTGIQKVTVNGKFVGWFLFTKGGNNVQNYWASDRYYLPDGRMASGVTKVNNTYYFFERSSTKQYRGKMYKGTWIKYNNKYYYAGSKGNLATNGWRTIHGGKYYFKNCTALTNYNIQYTDGTYGRLDERGKFTTEWIIIDNSKNRVRYMDPKTGRLMKNTTKTIDGINYRFDKYGNRVNDRTSEFKRSKYYLECDRVNGVMTIYTDSSKKIPIKTIRVSVGLPETPTKVGTFKITRADRWQLLMGPSWGQYGSHVVNGIYIHSVASGQPNGNNLPAGEYLKLGNPASHGCIRCCVADAKWIWENCNGSTIRVFDGKYKSDECFKGPLGRNPLTPLRGSGTFDPTDPNYN